jgi:hypothetical protein
VFTGTSGQIVGNPEAGRPIRFRDEDGIARDADSFAPVGPRWCAPIGAEQLPIFALIVREGPHLLFQD